MLPLKKHSDPVNPHVGCQLQTMPQSMGRVNLKQPHPQCPLPAQDKNLPSLPFLYCLFLLCVTSSVLPLLYLSPLRASPAASSLLDPLFTFLLPFLLIAHPPSVLFLFLLEHVLSSIIPSARRHDSRLSLEERTFHLLHTLTSLSLMNAFTPLVYKIEGVIHNQA